MKAYTEAPLAEWLIRFAEDHEIAATDDFVAAAGTHYGYVAAWEMPDLFGERQMHYAIKHGGNGQTNYSLTDEIADLAEWLIPRDADEDTPRIVANVRGIDAVEAVEDYVTGPVRILMTSFYHGAREETDWARAGNGTPLEFANAAEARTWIHAVDVEGYVLAHDRYVLERNETERPEFKIVLA